MSSLHCIWIVSLVLIPALVHAQSALDVPGNGNRLSGIGVIHGWKCEARGNITIRFNDGDSIPTTYGFSGEIQRQRVVMMGTTPFSPILTGRY